MMPFAFGEGKKKGARIEQKEVYRNVGPHGASSIYRMAFPVGITECA